MDRQSEIGWPEKWLIAARPWAWPASCIPVLFGSSLAATVGWVHLHLGLLLLSLMAMVILHSAANMLSDVIDWKRGLDVEVTPVSGAVVRGLLSSQQVLSGSIILFIIGSGLGIWLVFLRGILILKIGIAGVILGLAYPWLKAAALGDLVVLVNFGLLGSLGGWVVQTTQFSWLPVIWAVPQGMLIAAILHANNWRDSVNDRQKKVVTFSSLIGDRGSLVYYGILIFGSQLIMVGFVLVPRLFGLDFPSLPLGLLLVLLALPEAWKLYKKAGQRYNPAKPLDFITLDGATSRYNLLFGLLSVVGLWL
ncbi:MAG: prenyltransferase [Acidobacteriota bacterium]|nr:prenyltransferase [Acidobacteriota bacterium]MDW3228736.1 prenyltransferase [Acidobacteriota bacterium]MDY0231629.1 prenyltransferase [Candidatus Saccharicenans sp.]